MYSPLRLASFVYHNVFKVHLCCIMYQYFVSFYCQIIFHCIEIPHFVAPSFSLWTLELFPLFWLLWIVLLWTEHVCARFVWTNVFGSLGHIPRGAIAESYGKSMFTFWGTARLFSTVAALFYNPISNIRGSQFLQVLANTCYHLFDYRYPSGYEVVSYCSFDFHNPDAWWFLILFDCSIVLPCMMYHNEESNFLQSFALWRTH